MTMVCEAVETIGAARCNEGTPRVLFVVPTITFVTERQYGLRPEHAAHARTGRNIGTGKLTLGIGIRKRRNGFVTFDADLFKLDYNLSQLAIDRLYRHWHDLNADHSLPKSVLRRMDCHFSQTTIIFDAAAEQTHQWREFLREVLADAGSYVAIDYPASDVGTVMVH